MNTLAALLTSPMLAQSDEEAIAVVAVLIGALVGLVIGLAIILLVCFLIYKPYKSVPEAHRQMNPPMVFLLMIPLFGLVWAFFIALKIPASFKSHFDSVGDTSVGDCGKNIGLGWAICSVCSMIPFVNFIAAPASLVLLIIFIVKLFGLSGKIKSAAPVAA